MDKKNRLPVLKEVCLLSVVFFLIIINSGCKNGLRDKPIDLLIKEALDFSTQQSLILAENLAGQDSVLPRSYIDGKLVTTPASSWTSGFFPGTLWYLYGYNLNEKILQYASLYTARIENEKYSTKNHDLGFMLFCSFGNGLRLTGDSTYRAVLLTGASSLAKRYNPKLGVIRSWHFNKKEWQYPVIIDNMMNLELLIWDSEVSGNEPMKEMAISHADKTMANHYRPDNSSYHVVSYDTISGLPHKKQTHQGFSDESSWSRGQAWGLYGFTMMYRETGFNRYLDQAKKIAGFLSIIRLKNLSHIGI